MIKITIKYTDVIKPRTITISDSDIDNENELVDWVLNSMWNDCYFETEAPSQFYIDNYLVCACYFELLYKGYNIFDWYNSETGWENEEDSYITIEVV